MKRANSLVSGGALIRTEEAFDFKIIEKDSEDSVLGRSATYFIKLICSCMSSKESVLFLRECFLFQI